MPRLKPIHADSIPRTLAKAERYRLLNEPREAESICRDILAIDAGHQEAIVTLVLSITDQFAARHTRLADAQAIIPDLSDEYARHYYSGVAFERWAKSLLAQEGYESTAAECLSEAMDEYERAQSLAPSGNEDAVLRWNACVRLIERHGLVTEEAGSTSGWEIESFDDEVPPR